MNIVWITYASFINPVGITGRIEVPKWLAKFGHNVTVISQMDSRKKNCIEDTIHPTSVNNIYIRSLSLPYYSIISFQFLLLPKLFLIWIKEKPSCIITDPELVFTISLISVLNKLFKRKTKFWVDIRTFSVNTNNILQNLKNIRITISFYFIRTLFDSISVITEPLKIMIEEQFRIPKNRISVWTTGVSSDLFFKSDLPKFKSLPDKKNDNTFYVMYHGSLAPGRCLIETIDSIAYLWNKGYPIKLIIVGKGVLETQIKNLVTTDPYKDCLLFYGVLPYKKMPELINYADVGTCFLDPKYEFWKYQAPLKVLEYLAMEKVVILSDIYMHQKIIGTNPNGIFIEKPTRETIGEKIIYTYKNKNKLPFWGSFGREIIESKYTWEIQARKFEKALLSNSND